MTNEELLAQDNLLWTTEGRQRILALMGKARDCERERCAEIVQMARSAEIGQDWRTVIHFIEGCMSVEQIKAL